MASALTGAVYEERIDLNDKTLHCHLFSQDQGGIAVLWRTDKTRGHVSKVTLETGAARVSLQDMLGNNKAITKPTNGVVALELTGSPQYLRLSEGDFSSLKVHGK